MQLSATYTRMVKREATCERANAAQWRHFNNGKGVWSGLGPRYTCISLYGG